MNIRDAILSIELPREEVTAPAVSKHLNGTKVYMRGLLSSEFQPLSRKLQDSEDDWPVVAGELLARVLEDAQGKRVFRDEDASKLAQLPAGVLSPLWIQAARLSGFTEEAVEEAERNLGGTQRGATSSK